MSNISKERAKEITDDLNSRRGSSLDSGVLVFDRAGNGGTWYSDGTYGFGDDTVALPVGRKYTTADVLATFNPDPDDVAESYTRTWVLSADCPPGTVHAVLADLRLSFSVSDGPGWFPGGASVSQMGPQDTPPADLERLRAELVERGYRAKWW